MINFVFHTAHNFIIQLMKKLPNNQYTSGNVSILHYNVLISMCYVPFLKIHLLNDDGIQIHNY